MKPKPISILIWLLVLLLFITAVSGKEEFILGIVDIVEHNPNADMNDALTSNELIDIVVEVENIGDQIGYMKVECGIYQRDEVNAWYSWENIQPFAVVKPLPNCVSHQTNVATKDIYLRLGESTTQTFTVRAPDLGWGTSVDDLSEEFGIHCQAFENCWSYGIDTGRTDFDVKPIKLGLSFTNPTTSENCKDGLRNQDETGIDCGGDKCEGCPRQSRCDYNSDCQKRLECINDRCDVAQTATCGNGIVEAGENCDNCLEDIGRTKCNNPPNPPPKETCGNGQIDSKDTCLNCPQDFPEDYCGRPFPDEGGSNLMLLGIGAASLLVVIVLIGMLMLILNRK